MGSTHHHMYHSATKKKQPSMKAELDDLESEIKALKAKIRHLEAENKQLKEGQGELEKLREMQREREWRQARGLPAA